MRGILGGTGGGVAQHGVDCTPFPSNLSATPVEVAEHTAPAFIHGKSLREGSDGLGAVRLTARPSTRAPCRA